MFLKNGINSIQIMIVELFISGGFLDQNRRISSLGRLSKNGNTPTKVTNTGAPVCTLTATSSRSLHGGVPPSQTPTPTPQSTSASVKNQPHSSVELEDWDQLEPFMPPLIELFPPPASCPL